MDTGRYDFKINQGATFEREIRIENNNNEIVPFPGTTVRMQLRPNYDSEEWVSMTCFWKDEDDNSGVIVLRMTVSKTMLLTYDRYVYDLEIEDVGGNVDRILEGIIRVSKQVTY